MHTLKYICISWCIYKLEKSSQIELDKIFILHRIIKYDKFCFSVVLFYEL